MKKKSRTDKKMKRKCRLAFDTGIPAKLAGKVTETSENNNNNEPEKPAFESNAKRSYACIAKIKSKKTNKIEASSSSDSDETERIVEKKERPPSAAASREQGSSQEATESKVEIALFNRGKSLSTSDTSPQYSIYSSPQFMQWKRNLFKPLYRNHQLLGDSQFVRFSRQILRDKSGDNPNIGYCVSGQKIEDLYKMLKSKIFEIHEYVIILIGTNNLTRYCNYSDMTENYKKIIALLKPQTNRIVLLTVPPVQKMADSIRHWKIFEDYNKFILEQHDGQQVFVVDFGKHFVGYSGPCGSREYYEETYLDRRVDLVHLNRKGFLLLKFLLDIHYFGVSNPFGSSN